LDIPALCRILLKYCVRQAGRLPASTPAVSPKSDLKVDPFVKELQDDFNFGQPFDMNIYAPRLEKLVNMGFSQNEAMEALCIVENKGVEGALEVLVTDDKAKRKKRREEAVGRQNRSVNSMGTGGPPTTTTTGGTGDEQTAKELAALKKQYTQERDARVRSETELKTHLANLNKLVYKEYIRGMIADDTITVSDALQLQRYREQKQITQADHEQMLKEINLTPQKFEEMKKFKPKTENECVVCLDKPKDHVIFNCMHLCLCENCVTDINSKKNPKCPLCSKKITKIVRIFNS